MNAVVTGASGFIGQALCAVLRENHWDIVTITRRPPEGTPAALAWDDTAAWQKAVANADAVFHLAGEPVAGQRWTPEYKAKILSSRVETTRAIANAKPRVLVCASAVGFYGDRNDDVVTEGEPPANDFLARVCVAWEAEAEKTVQAGSRVVHTRIGIVLGRGGGPLQTMLYPGGPSAPSPWKLGLGGPLGNGSQWVPWVHLQDAARLLFWCAAQETVSGPVNVVAPTPATNRDLSHAVGAALGKPAVVPTPAFVLRTAVGEFAYALLYSQRVVPTVAQTGGFAFRFDTVQAALADIITP